ncbi:Uma2 family endonuclease [Streptomyces sp. E11-3]
MTAESLSEPASEGKPARSSKRVWPVPPPGGWTVDHLFSLPDLPPHTELIDGSLVFVSPQRSFHTLTMYLLEAGLRSTVPGDLRVRREMTVVIDKRQGPEPDISVVRAEAVSGGEETHYPVADVVLAVEVVSPDSESRDRERKPELYAKGGIPHFWRIEQSEDGRPAVYVYELDPATGAYVSAGVHHDRLKLSVPFTVDIDLSAIEDM